MAKPFHGDRIRTLAGSSSPLKPPRHHPGRDGSPVSVITHSALISQPSSACTSMEHRIYQEAAKNQPAQDHGESTSDDDGFDTLAKPLPQECLKVGALESLPEAHSLFLQACEAEEGIIGSTKPDPDAAPLDYLFPSKARVHLPIGLDMNGSPLLSKNQTVGREAECEKDLPKHAKCVNKSANIRPSSRVIMTEEVPKGRDASHGAAMGMMRGCRSPGAPSMVPSRSSFSGLQSCGRPQFPGADESRGNQGLLACSPGQVAKPGMLLKGMASKWEDAEQWLNSNMTGSPAHPRSRVHPGTGAKASKSSRRDTNCHVATVATTTVVSEMGGAVMPINRSHHDTSDDSELPVSVHEYRVLVRSASQKLGHGVKMAVNSTCKHQGAYSRDDSSPVRKGDEQALVSRLQCSESLAEDKYTDIVMETSGKRRPNIMLQDHEFVAQACLHGRSASMKDAATEVSPTVSRRDMATQITPLSSSHTSRSVTPIKNESPARHNTPTKQSGPCNNAPAINLQELESCHLAKLQLRSLPAGSSQFQSFDKSLSSWSTKEDEEEESSECLNSAIEARAAVWEEAERIKHSAKYVREETRIEAWENHQKAKAEAELKKLEVKLEKLRADATEKIMNKLATSHRKAEEMRACAKAQHAEQVAKASECAAQIRRSGHVPAAANFGICFSLPS